ncbi:glycerol-3-phosphate responsive antiterminator [Bacillus taeanensis]|uniref:Glycerol uptake operon antiterminator regulatory protein n=1 Tax=Bacillus taeanensis TaxID=273032 RepID=A0A366XT36_9BACI|nr:glycerol-3-phosphate responsive antiterminator [Bacillus taeanensis]RBW69540.1 glycerol-3-phosphate responsive antiterminator GlpP [Bacillus taeanensis]
MNFNGQKVLPAVKKMKDFEKILAADYQYIVLLDIHIGQLHSLMQHAKIHNKKIFLHADLIQGLKNDEYAAEFLCQTFKPFGLISTRGSVLRIAKKKGIVAIQRLFLLDTIALETSYKLVEKVRPDFIEVLPGVVPHLIKEVNEATDIPIIAGGLIRTKEEVEQVLQAGAVAVTTSRNNLWI